VVALDLPGFGDSDPAEGGLDAVADRVAEAIDLLGFDQTPIFLGNGYGGFVALLTVIRNPGIAVRMVLAGCGATFTEAGRAAFRTISAIANEKGLAAAADIAIRRLFSRDYQAGHPDLIAERRQRFLQIAPRTFHRACDALATLDLRSDLAAVRVPVLMLAGEFDEATPPPMARELVEGVSNARLRILPGCAHVPQLQEPALFLSVIAEFLEGREDPDA
jgi:3-oxoadipate enol-lactonase